MFMQIVSLRRGMTTATYATSANQKLFDDSVYVKLEKDSNLNSRNVSEYVFITL